MRKNKIFLTAVLFVTFLALLSLTIRVLSRPNRLARVEKWFILLDYDPSRSAVSESDMAAYDMAILDADSHPPIAGLRNKPILIAYVSLGEAESYRSYWSGIKDRPWIIGENPHWKENYYVDVRDKEWQDLLIEKVIPDIVAKGFDGIFMDTLDTAMMLEAENATAYSGSNDAMAFLVASIRAAFPKLLMISNNGFMILDEIAPDIDGALVEDITMMIDFENNGYKKVPEREGNYKIAALTALAKEHHLPIFVIDYVSERDSVLRQFCIQKSKALGFRPYVAEKDLDRIYAQ